MDPMLKIVRFGFVPNLQLDLESAYSLLYDFL